MTGSAGRWWWARRLDSRRTRQRDSESQRRARAVLDDLFGNLVAEEREQVRRCEAALASAQRQLAEVQARQVAWQRDGTFDHLLGVRALLMAQIADLDSRTQPTGANMAAMLAFLTEHHPPRNVDQEVPPGPAGRP